MSKLNKVLMFPSRLPKQNLRYLPSVSKVYDIPPFVEQALEGYLNKGKNDFFGEKMICGFFMPDKIFATASDVAEDVNGELQEFDKVLLFGPYELLKEAHALIEDSYFHEAREDDMEYVIEFEPLPDDQGFFPLVRPLIDVEKVYLN